ncbi:sodium:solute symporter [Pedobacter sp. HMF7647]|uniref:Sodium:solute symporter n=1 Tax=Hufsiella arboris TaxID=2695275 RepID=A0A7K1Y9A8_9SPHI|nr:sodium:solute symporter [Hufsiella arboris]MXV51167.1 sodium:solute symporter [Hufsiella arboris]
MSLTDWIVMIVTLAATIIYGVYKGRGQNDSRSYLLADRKMPWYIVLLGIMATQASAITFLSAPGQAYTDGLRFVQYYFGLPLAMIVISITFIPIFQRLNVCTAYEYLEQRFDRKTRVLTSLLFLVSRGLSTGISVYAPSIILSSVMGWNIIVTNICMGGFLIIYTFIGGARAVAHTQKLQFLIILCSIVLAAFLLVKNMPGGASLGNALTIAGKSGKLNAITTNFDWKDRYNIWSGLIGGFFLALSYFGTDQSQVGRYISAKDTSSGRMGLLINGLVKIPMQFFILLIGAVMFAFYSLSPAPLYFNENALDKFNKTFPAQADSINKSYTELAAQYNNDTRRLIINNKQGDQKSVNADIIKLKSNQEKIALMREQFQKQLDSSNISTDKSDTNYIFLYFVKHNLPIGVIGLLFAVIFLASWASISAALNSLAASSLTDVHLLLAKRTFSGTEEVFYGRIHTLIWGIFSIAVAMFASRMGSLIEAVNILGSIFYGPILGVFMVAFYMKRIRGGSVFIAAIISQLLVVLIYSLDIVSFLWLNVIGCFGVMIFSLLIPAKAFNQQISRQE